MSLRAEKVVDPFPFLGFLQSFEAQGVWTHKWDCTFLFLVSSSF